MTRSLFRTVLTAAALVATVSGATAARNLRDIDRYRQEAEHACYQDANTLCPDAIPDEDKVTACFKAKRAQLSASCRKIFDAGLKSTGG